MKIKKPLGNNAILTEDENGIEQVAIGNGIGFKKREGDEVDQSKIQNIYVVKDEDTKYSNLEKVIQNIQPDNIVLASKIIEASRHSGISFCPPKPGSTVITSTIYSLSK